MSTQNNTATAEGKDIAPRTIIAGIPLVENARLIEVTTINKKVAEQLPQRGIRKDEVTLPNVEILGRLENLGRVIVREGNRLCWIHEVDWIEWMTRTTGDINAGWHTLRHIPQMFTA
jgi:hypothetical protein